MFLGIISITSPSSNTNARLNLFAACLEYAEKAICKWSVRVLTHLDVAFKIAKDVYLPDGLVIYSSKRIIHAKSVLAILFIHPGYRGNHEGSSSCQASG